MDESIFRMKMHAKSYCLNWTVDVAAGAVGNRTAVIGQPLKTLKLISIFFDWYAVVIATQQVITPYNNFTQDIICGVHSTAAFNPISDLATNVAPAVGSANAVNLILYNPGQVELDGMFASIQFDIQIQHVNRDLLNIVTGNFSLIIKAFEYD